VLTGKDATLETSVDQRSAELQKLLDEHRAGNGFVSYDTVPQDRRRTLSAAVDALSEPLSPAMPTRGSQPARVRWRTRERRGTGARPRRAR
jgi:iron uptake system component EfeO